MFGVALVVGEQEDDIGAFASEFGVNTQGANEGEEEKADHGWSAFNVAFPNEIAAVLVFQGREH